MKFSSPPSYSSPSSTATFSSDMRNSTSATAGCLAGIFRRILCSRSLPTHPSDEIKEVDFIQSDKDKNLKAKENAEATTVPPGIVARLMGLDSMPDINLGNTQRNSISRSRSMNSMDYLGQLDQKLSLHRRAKSTLSSLDVPTFLELENDNFFILRFESGSGNTEFGPRRRKSELGSGELKQRRAERCKNKENRTEGVSVKKDRQKLSMRLSDKSSKNVNDDGCLKEITNTLPPVKGPTQKPNVASEAAKSSKLMDRKEVVNGERLRGRKKKTICGSAKKIELDNNSEDLSPISVLDFDRQNPRSETGSCSVSLNLRRKLSPQLENDKHLCRRIDNDLMVDERKMKTIESSKDHGSKNKVKDIQENLDVWGKICRAAENELVGANWIDKGMCKQDDLEIITADFEDEILHQLLVEVIDELGGHVIKTILTVIVHN
ncbi:transcriptional regulator ATRX-like isoform X2 [Quillaja saponaria]|uniref:Transcriptional regulator ATRX-like isoform X2 n=1 Tax=Quillaja saponaria TaxID=32244 RepID=A0AAD7LKW7_QUISA|nr:transcriptional regulator ATRX-like isoform X2 [Quillaja saponaria]